MPETEIYINFVTQHATPKTISLDDIRAETARDPMLQSTIEALSQRKMVQAEKQTSLDVETFAVKSLSRKTISC